MGNKEEELEIWMQLQCYDFTAITETWWDNSYDRNVVMEGYVLFRKYQPGR